MSFSYKANNTSFTKPLEKSVCTAKTEEGLPCDRVTFVEPLCPAHLAQIFNVAVRPSSIPDAGLGVFALRDFKKNEILTPPYTGRTMNDAELFEIYQGNTSPYALEIKKDVNADAAWRRSWGAFINHAKKPNAKFAIYCGTANIRAVADIKAGSEIFLDYGKDYFQTKHHTEIKTTFPSDFKKEMRKAFYA